MEAGIGGAEGKPSGNREEKPHKQERREDSSRKTAGASEPGSDKAALALTGSCARPITCRDLKKGPASQ